MIVEKKISFLRLFRIIWRELLCILAVSGGTVTSLIYFHLDEYAINVSIPLVIGTAIAIFLGFRTNSAYERWWEARKIWGGIVSDSRNLVRLCNDFFGTTNQSDLATHRQTIRKICYRQAAWAQVVNRHFKGLPLEGVGHLLSSDELAAIEKAHDPALMILSTQGREIRTALEQGLLDSRQGVLLEESLNRLMDHYGGCQRIKNTVFPVHYSFFTRIFIWVFLVVLGFSLPFHENANYFLIPAIFMIGWIFFTVEGIGSYMQDPFENNRNVIPTDALARMIEINLREMIGETDLPKPIEPIDGALY